MWTGFCLREGYSWSLKAGFNSLKHQALKVYVPQKKKDWICDFCIPVLTSMVLSSTSVMHDSEFLKWNGFSCIVLDHSELILDYCEEKIPDLKLCFTHWFTHWFTVHLNFPNWGYITFLLLCSMISTDGPLGFRNYIAPLQTLQWPPSQDLFYTDQI